MPRSPEVIGDHSILFPIFLIFYFLLFSLKGYWCNRQRVHRCPALHFHRTYILVPVGCGVTRTVIVRGKKSGCKPERTCPFYICIHYRRAFTEVQGPMRTVLFSDLLRTLSPVEIASDWFARSTLSFTEAVGNAIDRYVTDLSKKFTSKNGASSGASSQLRLSSN